MKTKARRCVALAVSVVLLLQTAVTALSEVRVESAQEPDSSVSKELKLWYDEQAPNNGRLFDGTSEDGTDPDWENWSLPLGCGYMGLNVFGRTDTERIQVTENSLCAQHTGGTREGGSLQNFAEVYLDFGQDPDQVSNYTRDLVLNDATSHVAYTYEGVQYEREYFSSYPDKVSVIKLKADTPGSISFTLRPEIPYLKGGNNGRTGNVTAEGDTVTLAGTMTYYGINYEGQVKVLNTGGTLTPSTNDKGNGVIEVSGADEVTLVLAVGTNYHLTPSAFTAGTKNKVDPKEFPHARVSQILSDASAKSYGELRAAHVADYKEYFDRVAFDLGAEIPSYTTDEMLSRYKAGSAEPYLEELYFQYGRYLLISSSREGCLPANLQGIWSQYEKAPWGGTYMHNINVQMNYWPAFNTNLSELFQPYADYNEAFRPAAQKAADNYLSTIKSPNKKPSGNGQNGWAVGTSCTPYQFSSPSVGGHSGPGTGGLTSNLFWEYYDFTRDPEILENVAYPAVSGMAEFLSKTLFEYGDKLLVKYSASPESKYQGKHYQTTGCAFDQQMIQQTLQDTLDAAAALGNDTDEIVATANSQIGRLDPVQVGYSGQVKEYREENFYGEYNDDKQHRHISQLMGLYPGDIINHNTPAWLDAAVVTLNNRGDGGTGWSMGHKINLWARTGDGNRSYDLVQSLLKNSTRDNLWDTHPPFQIDGNLGGTAGIAEMLLQSHEGYIVPMAAIPDEWTDGSYRGLTARGNFEVSADWRDGQAQSFAILSKSGGSCSVKHANLAGAAVTDSDGNPVSFTSEGSDLITFETEAGKTYTVGQIPSLEKVAPVSGLSLQVTAPSQLQISWTPSADAVSYNLYQAVESAPDYTLIASGLTEPSYLYTLETGTQCTFRVTAVGKDGRESAGVQQVLVPVQPPEHVTGYLQGSSLQIRLSQQDEGEIYTVYRQDGDSYETLLSTSYPVICVQDIASSDKIFVSRRTNQGESEKTGVILSEGYQLENVCLNKTVTADREAYSGYPLSAVVDGNLGSRVAFPDAAAGTPLTMTIELGQMYPLNELKISEWEAGTTRSDKTKCEILNQQGEWETVFENESLNCATRAFDMGGRTASSIRLTLINSTSAKGPTLYEVQCSTKPLPLPDKQLLFSELTTSDSLEAQPGFGEGVDAGVLDAYYALKAQAKDALLSDAVSQTQQEIDELVVHLRAARGEITGESMQNLLTLIGQARAAIDEITPAHSAYNLEAYNGLIASLQKAISLSNNSDASSLDLEAAADELRSAINRFRGEGAQDTLLELSDKGGTIGQGQKTVSVTASGSTPVALHYTMDGSEPTVNSPRLITSQIRLPYGLTQLKVAAFTAAGAQAGETVSANYMCRASVNLAKGKTVTAHQSHASFPVANAVDGKTNTRWACTTSDPTTWFLCEFGEAQTIDSIYIDEYKDAKNQQPNRLYEYTLEYQTPAGNWVEISKGSVYDKEARVVATSETSHSYVAIGFEPVEATALRLTGPGNISFYEFEAYGTPAETSKTLLEQALTDAKAIERAAYSDSSLKNLDDAVALGEQTVQNGTADEMGAAAQAIHSAVASLEAAKAVIIKQPIPAAVSIGEPALFELQAQGKELSYQWQEYCDGLWVSIPDATLASLVVPTVSEADSGRRFRCVVTDLGGSVLSQEAELNVTDEPSVPVDKTILRTVLAYAEEQFASPEFQKVIELVQNSYTAALEQARSVEQSASANQEDVDNAWKTMMKEIHKLGFVQGDKTLLEQLIQTAKDFYAQIELYTPSTASAFIEKLSSANEVLIDHNAMEQEVVTAQDNLLEAMTNLRYRADKSILNALVAHSDEIQTDGFTPESVAVFNEARRAAKDTLNDEEATQQQVNEAVSQLSTAMSALQLVNQVAGDSRQTTQEKNARTGEAAPLAEATALLVLAGFAFLVRRKR